MNYVSDNVFIMSEYFNKLSTEVSKVVATLTKRGVASKYLKFGGEGDIESVKVPTGARSEFLANRAMGDWAENTLSKLIDTTFSNKLKPIHYGDSDEISAEDEKFSKSYRKKIEDTRIYGKRPDILLLPSGFECNSDVSLKSTIENDEIANNSEAAIEVRSSKFEASIYESVKKEDETQLQESKLTNDCIRV